MKISVHTSEKTDLFTVMKTNLLHKEIITSHETPQIGFSVWYFCNVTPCSQKINVTEEPVAYNFYHECGGFCFLKNVGTFVSSYKASQPRKTNADFHVHMLCGQNSE